MYSRGLRRPYLTSGMSNLPPSVTSHMGRSSFGVTLYSTYAFDPSVISLSPSTRPYTNAREIKKPAREAGTGSMKSVPSDKQPNTKQFPKFQWKMVNAKIPNKCTGKVFPPIFSLFGRNLLYVGDWHLGFLLKGRRCCWVVVCNNDAFHGLSAGWEEATKGGRNN